MQPITLKRLLGRPFLLSVGWTSLGSTFLYAVFAVKGLVSSSGGVVSFIPFIAVISFFLGIFCGLFIYAPMSLILARVPHLSPSPWSLPFAMLVLLSVGAGIGLSSWSRSFGDFVWNDPECVTVILMHCAAGALIYSRVLFKDKSIAT